MTKYALLLEPQLHGILATCAIVGDPSIYYGKSKTFSDVDTLRVALNEARIADIAVNTAVQTIVNGFNGFAYITSDNAQSLGLLESAVTPYKDVD